MGCATWAAGCRASSGRRRGDPTLRCDFTSTTTMPWPGTMTTKSASPCTWRTCEAMHNECRTIQSSVAGCDARASNSARSPGGAESGSTAASFEPLRAPIRSGDAHVVTSDQFGIWRDRKHTRRDDPPESWKIKIKAQMAVFFQRGHAGGRQRPFE